MVKNASDYGKLAELQKEKEEKEALLDHKIERWEYLSDINEKMKE
jgi:ATP-binding cassette subfamily F protein uup